MEQNTKEALMAVGAGIQLSKTNEIAKSVKGLSRAMERQENLLYQVSGQQAELIDLAKRQTLMMELELQRKQVERAVKESVFQLRQHLESIKKNPSALGQHFLYRATLSNLDNPNIKTENIDSIEEKEYFVETMNALKKGVQDSIDNISKEELEELAKFQSIAEFKGLHNQTEQTKKDMELKFKLNKRVLTKTNTFLSALISFVLCVPAAGFNAQSIFSILLLVTIISIILFVRVLGRDLFEEDPVTKQKKTEEKLKKMEAELDALKERTEELFPGKNLNEVNSIQAEFLKKYSMLCEQVDFTQFQSVIDISPQIKISKDKDYEV